MSTVLPLLFIFMLGFTLGALASWWVTWNWECPKKQQAGPGVEEGFDMALRIPEHGPFEVYFQGRWYRDARALVPAAFQRIQQMSFRLLRWLDEAERPRYVTEADLRTSRGFKSAATPTTAVTGLERMHEEIDELVRRKAREMGITVPVRIASAGHTVVIWVGDAKYERLADIPDEEVRRLIRAAVQEWERRWRMRQRAYQNFGGSRDTTANPDT